jgi:hypothetical protein
MKYILSFLLLINVVFAQRINIVKDSTALPSTGSYEDQIVTVSGVPFLWQRGGWYQLSTNVLPYADTVGSSITNLSLNATAIGLPLLINAKQLVASDTVFIKYLINIILSDTTRWNAVLAKMDSIRVNALLALKQNTIALGDTGNWNYVFTRFGIDSTNMLAGYTYRVTSATGTAPLTLGLSSNAITGSIDTTSGTGLATINRLSRLYATLISPSFTTPVLGTPTSGNIVNCTGAPAISDTNFIGRTGGGTPTSSQVGYIVTSKVATGSAVSCSTGVAKTVTSISLPAGYWLVSGNVNFNLTSATTAATSKWQIGINNAASIPTNGTEVDIASLAMTTTSALWGESINYNYFNLTTTTTIYLESYSTFTAGTVTAFGSITAIRIN